jgi:hypothetical protein
MMRNGYITGMHGVYLVAAHLSKLGWIVSPTSRSARGTDLLVTDMDCQKAFSVQVKTNARTFGFFLVGKHAVTTKSKSHIFVLVNLKRDKTEYFVVPSLKLSPLVKPPSNKTGAQFWAVYCRDLESFRDRWRCFGKSLPFTD